MASTCVVQGQTREADHISLEALPRREQLTTDSSNDLPGAFSALEKWNSPRINMYRSFSTFWSFLVMGANDAAYGVSFKK